ncbi:MAG: hypothetical protein QF491_08850, partial [Alphaproteobacteria bacterium]|nr:hypothetical protein [Alphaproteobacteria bacterium]
VLQALLVGSGQLSTIFCLSLLHYDAQDVLKEVFPEYRPQLGQDGLVPDAVPAFTKHSDHFPSSIYLKVTGER